MAFSLSGIGIDDDGVMWAMHVVLDSTLPHSGDWYDYTMIDNTGFTIITR
jgi:hypothetical protein